MVNSHKKGITAEREAKKILENDNYKVFRPVWSQWAPKDMFGLFDILAIHKTHGWKLIQVKSGKSLAKGIETLKRELAMFIPYTHGASIELWIRWQARWRGRGKNKHYEEKHWETHIVNYDTIEFKREKVKVKRFI